jgi:hypothetical protein
MAGSLEIPMHRAMLENETLAIGDVAGIRGESFVSE